MFEKLTSCGTEMQNESIKLVKKYWEVMNSNDFTEVSKLLSNDFICHWPQSSELIRGRENFAQINSAYPVNNRWVFIVNQIVSEKNRIVTDVSVRDEEIEFKVITFFFIENGFIKKQIEYWPDNYPAPEWRKEWVEIIE